MSLENEIETAIHSHERWKAKLNASIDQGKVNAELADIGIDNVCPFGRWLYGPTIPNAARFDPNYIIVQFLHAKFHQCAGLVAQALSEGRAAEARALMADDGEYAKTSDQLIATLAKWRDSVHKTSAVTLHRNKMP